MPTNIRIIHARDFIKATPEGNLDLEESKKLLIEIASASAPLLDYEIILDTRKAQSEMSVTDLWHLAAELSSLRNAFSRKTAVLVHLNDLTTQGSSQSAPKTKAYKSEHSLLLRMQSNG